MGRNVKILLTGGCGFIGSAVIRHLIRDTDAAVVNLDKLTYAANPEALEDAAASERYRFERIDICDRDAVAAAFRAHQPDIVMHLAAETHVDRSIDGPAAFIETNVVGTFNLLHAAKSYHDGLDAVGRDRFRFHHISTDEVYGTLGLDDPPFAETHPYRPNSPYSASKAGADHLVRAWGETYGLPTILTNCSNNYGPWQFPEKLIPLMIIKALRGEALPVYGAGGNIRDWLHVDDHARALWLVATRGTVGECYNIGGRTERTNLEVVRAICAVLDGRRPQHAPHDRLISFVTDRPGHDLRYAIATSKIERELGWAPRHEFASGLAALVDWYIEHEPWWRSTIEHRRSDVRVGLVGAAR